jgi:hypothetical protein
MLIFEKIKVARSVQPKLPLQEEQYWQVKGELDSPFTKSIQT